MESTSERFSGEAPHPWRRLRVLLAEDDAEMRRYLEFVLRREGFQVTAVPSGHAVLEHLGSWLLTRGRDGLPDVILSDIRMPGCSGLEVLAAVRRLGWDLPVVLITAFGDERSHTEARRLGAVAVLDKPFEKEPLLRVLHSLESSG